MIFLSGDLKLETDRLLSLEIKRLRGRDLSFRIRYKKYEVDEVLEKASRNSSENLVVFAQMLCVGTYVTQNVKIGLRLMEFFAKKSDVFLFQLSFVHNLLRNKEREIEIICNLSKKNFAPALRRKATFYMNGAFGEKDASAAIRYLRLAAKEGNVRAKMTLTLFFLKNGGLSKRFFALITLPIVYIKYLRILATDNLNVKIM